MASYTANRVKSQTLGASTVDTVTLNSAYAYVEIYNRSGFSAGISFTVDGTTPTALGDNCFVVGAGQSLTVKVPVASTLPGTTVVKLISVTADPYTVTGVVQ